MRKSEIELQNRPTDVSGSAGRVSGVARAVAPARLHVVHPPELARTLELTRPRLVLGRQPGDDSPALLNARVSRRHFAVEWDAERGVHVGVDLGSANGSAVDGVTASEAVELPDGAVIRVGPVLLVYEAPCAGAQPEVDGVSRDAIPGSSRTAASLRAAVAAVASDPSPVVLQGETGTGKERVAQELHRLSARPGRFVPVNCAALSPELVESELFGHVRGAFSGATHDQPGLFRAAHGGTLLLDEVGELPAALQPKLLRVLQEQEVRPVGATRPVKVDVRVIAATHRDLPAMVEQGDFRRDLHARLSLWEIRVPPLRERRADLLTWLARLHARFRQARGESEAGLPPLSSELVETLLSHPWPDNLRGVDRLARALALASASGPLTPSALPGWLTDRDDGDAPRQTAAARPARRPSDRAPIPSREELSEALERFDGSVRAVARHFGRDRKQIYRWLRSHGLRDD